VLEPTNLAFIQVNQDVQIMKDGLSLAEVLAWKTTLP
jgi:hypothetical protein